MPIRALGYLSPSDSLLTTTGRGKLQLSTQQTRTYQIRGQHHFRGSLPPLPPTPVSNVLCISTCRSHDHLYKSCVSINLGPRANQPQHGSLLVSLIILEAIHTLDKRSVNETKTYNDNGNYSVGITYNVQWRLLLHQQQICVIETEPNVIAVSSEMQDPVVH